jgi:hypothetical protein
MPLPSPLATLAESSDFKTATSGKIKTDRMTDREFVLRSLAFMVTSYKEYRIKNFDVFLNETMQRINLMTSDERDSLSNSFYRGINAAHALFEGYAFRKRFRVETRKPPINKALFEVWTVGLSNLTDAQLSILLSRDEVERKLIQLIEDPVFNSAISQSTGDLRKVEKRFSAIENLIKEVINDSEIESQ